MGRFTRLAFTLLALTGASPALAQQWHVSAISGAKPDRTVYLLDSASIVRNGDRVDFTTQSIFEQLTDGRDFDRSVTQRSGDCTTISSRIVRNSYFAGGAFMNTDDVPGDIKAHADGTIMHDVMDQVCGIKPMEPGTVADPETTVRSYFAKN